MGSFKITPQGFKQFCSFLEENCGIVLTENKQYLVQCRLAKVMELNAFDSLELLIEKMSGASGKQLSTDVIDAMTTNETLWFRDAHPYDVLRKKLFPEYLVNSRSRIKIWSAACSTGQEPYSISIVGDEYIEANLALKGAKLDIVATDISSEALNLAKQGKYELFALGRGLSQERKIKYFEEFSEGVWRVSPKIKSSVSFKGLNLLDTYGSLGSFDVIFCRNVLIYFSPDVKRTILEKMHAQLRKGGYLVLGASESLPGLSNKFEMINCHPGIVYRAI